MWRTYYSLTKPGMIRGNAIITAAGFLYASHGRIDPWLLLETIIGISCVIAAGCVTNNYLDRDIDAKMNRTKGRAFPMQKISGAHALVFAGILGAIGFICLAVFTNALVVLLAALGALFYVALYTPLKHTSPHAALVGSIAGAIPIVVGYCAVSKTFDLTALLLMLILIIWQMPHFFAISLYRFDEYKAANVPVFPIQKGRVATKIHMLVYIVLFILATALLIVTGATGFIAGSIIVALGICWFLLCTIGFTTKYDDKRWAKNMFVYSLIVIMVFSVTLSLAVLA